MTKEELLQEIKSLRMSCNAFYQLMIDRIRDLEKENAELKNRIKTLTIHDTNAVLSGLEMKVLKESHRNRANKTQDQLTKAKELLNEFMRISKASVEEFEHDYSELIAEAEQFLKNDGCPDVMCEDCTKEDCGIKKLGLVEVEK